MGEWAEHAELEHAPDPLIGVTIEGYRLERLLGRGGTSRVYLGVDFGRSDRDADGQAAANAASPEEGERESPSGSSRMQTVAIKVLTLSRDLPASARMLFQTRFLREAQAACRLQHPHLLPVLRAGEAHGHLYMIMPALTGGTLATRLAVAHHSLSFEEIIGYIRQVADALDYVHYHGIVHRDVKPSNILLDERGRASLSDFGIAHLLTTRRGSEGESLGLQPPLTLTTTGQVMGTPHYMAPEQITGAPMGPETDVYALGVVLYQLVTGRLPYDGETPFEIAAQHLQGHPRSPRLLRPDLCVAAEVALLRALAKDPAERFGSAGRLAEAFAAGVACDEALNQTDKADELVTPLIAVPAVPLAALPIPDDTTLADVLDDRNSPASDRTGWVAANGARERNGEALSQHGALLARIGRGAVAVLVLLVLLVLIQRGVLAGFLAGKDGGPTVPPVTTLATPSPTATHAPAATRAPTTASSTVPAISLSWQGTLVFARRSSDGTLLWSFQTDKPIIAAPQVKGGVVYVTDEEHIYLLRLSDGALLSRQDSGGDH